MEEKDKTKKQTEPKDHTQHPVQKAPLFIL